MSRALSERFGVTRQAAVAALKRLAADGWLEKSGRATRPIWAPGPNRLVYFRETLPAQEHQVWIDRVGSYLTLSPNVEALAFYCFTEILNNASEHSGGKSVFIWVRQSPEYL